MRFAPFVIAGISALGLAACQPAEKTSHAVSADTVPADATTTSPAIADPVGPTTDAAPPAPGATPPVADSRTINPDGTMSDGAANPASPPPVAAPDDMAPPKGG
jgi:hypothetical protein